MALNKIFVRSALTLGLFVLPACSKHTVHEDALFHGECRLEVHSKEKGAKIIVDAIEVGHDDVALELPCGEKSIVVEKSGRIPYDNYITVQKGEPIRLHVELAETKSEKIEALSDDLLQNIKNNTLKIASSGPSKSGGASAAVVDDSGVGPAPAPGTDKPDDWR